jgi:hypothetical protein
LNHFVGVVFFFLKEKKKKKTGIGDEVGPKNIHFITGTALLTLFHGPLSPQHQTPGGHCLLRMYMA